MYAIVLAAGRGRRVGGSKARLLVGGRPLLRLHLERLRACGFVPVSVVREADGDLLAGDAHVVLGDAPEQAGSLALGVAALPPDTEVVLVTPVDVLPALPATLRRLTSALEPGVLAVVPTFRGRAGHPVLLRREVLAPYETGAPPLRDVLAALGDRRVLLDVDDRNVVTDLDDAARVEAATGGQPRFA